VYRSVVLPALLTLVLAASPARAETWTVAPDGSGDFPTIAAAIGAATNGDIIELADGIFTGDGNRNLVVYNRSLTIRSESGDPSACVIDPEGGPGLTRRAFSFQGTPSTFVVENVGFTGGTALGAGTDSYGGAIIFRNSSSPTSPTLIGCAFSGNEAGSGAAMLCLSGCSPSFTDCTFVGNVAEQKGGAAYMTTDCFPVFERCIFRENSATSGGALYCGNNTSPTFTYCTFYANSATTGSTAWCRWDPTPVFVNSILAFAPSGAAITAEYGAASPTLTCCNVYGNAEGDWVDCIAGLESANGNLSADPLLCEPELGDLFLQWGSPCLPAHSGGCGTIGACGPGNCPSMAVDSASWGSVKGAYR
jgi:predicted outer membrane repeat protein